MTLPFSVEQFFEVFATYNAAVWPAQIVAYLAALAALAAPMPALHPYRYSGRIVSAILAAFWIWIGVVYHMMFFRAINPAALGFGVFFVVQGLLFLLTGTFRDGLRFEFGLRPIPIVGAVFIVYAMVGYPLLSASLGHGYPTMPTFGLTPCPTTIFTFGLLLWALPTLPRYLIVIPFVWSLVGTTAALQLDVPADYGLGLAAAVTLIITVVAGGIRANRVPRTA